MTSKRLLYTNDKIINDINYNNIIVFPFNGCVDILHSCIIIVKSALVSSELLLVNITNPENEIIVGDIKFEKEGLYYIEWSAFHDLPTEQMSILQLRGKTTGSIQIMSIEFEYRLK